jgi:putative transposase
MNPTRHPRYARHRFPAEVISHAVWLYFRFPLSLHMVEEMLAARGILVSHETVRQWALKFGQSFAKQIRRRLPAPGDKWHLDEVAISISGRKHWLWRAVDQHGMVLDILVQSRRNGSVATREQGREGSRGIVKPLCGEQVKLLGERQLPPAGIFRLVFTHHMNQLDAP